MQYFITTICETSDNVKFPVLTTNVTKASSAVRDRDTKLLEICGGGNISNVIYKSVNFKKNKILAFKSVLYILICNDTFE